MPGDADDTNYDEARVADHPLTDPLTFPGGEPVATAHGWLERRRPTILELFDTHVFGRSPGRPSSLSVKWSPKMAAHSAAQRYVARPRSRSGPARRDFIC